MAKDRKYKVTDKHRARILSMEVDRKLRKNGITPTNQSINRVSATDFHKAITAGKKANSKGWMVDVHTVKEYRGMRCYLTSDGMSGIAIKRNGDVVSLFSTGGGRKLGKLLPFAVAAGGKKLDCYGGGLQNMYAVYGAVATGRTPFSEEYAPSDWNKADGKPDVVAMILPKSLDDVIKSYDKGREIELSKVPLFTGDSGYDDMIADRDRKLGELRRSDARADINLTS